MIEFVTVNDDDPTLAHSPMVRAIGKTFAYIAENGPIGLTPSKAFKRVFVHWAAAESDCPRLIDHFLGPLLRAWHSSLGER